MDSWESVPGGLWMRENPFAKGGQRNAYHVGIGSRPSAQSGHNHYVAKESRWEGDDSERLSTLKVSIAQTMRAAELARSFNEALSEADRREGRLRTGEISVIPCTVYRLTMPNGSVRYMSVERWLNGRYIKHNGNNGYIAEGDEGIPTFLASSTYNEPLSAAAATSLLPQAFSHWSFEHSLAEASDSSAMVCDIQGVGLNYTDVTVHTSDRRFGSTDLGELGFQKFFQSHKCNAACEALGLTRCQPSTEPRVARACSASTATEQIQLIRTKHLRDRKRQRDVETIEMQRAVKHGRKQVGANSNVKHTHGDVSVVTDASGKVGVTAFRSGVEGRRAPVPLFGTNGWAAN